MKIERYELTDARGMRLLFAQVREDPLLEIEALCPRAGEKHVVISSGGCTALSLMASGGSHIVAVDLNRTQNHLVELKAAAVARLGSRAATSFLGGAYCLRSERLATYDRLRDVLSVGARSHWDAQRASIARGVLSAGVTERFMGVLALAIKLFVNGRRRVEQLLRLETLDAQKAFYRRRWNNWRWRALFAVMLNRWVFDRTYHPSFFAHVRNSSFARHFHRLVERGLTEIPVATNYFLHFALNGRYPVELPGGVPPYLAPTQRAESNLQRGQLTLVDGSVLGWLQQANARSVDGYALSNICEWLAPHEIDQLFAQIFRTAKPGARVVFCNFVGWTEVPPKWRARFVEDRARGAALIAADRSLVQSRIAVCSLLGSPAMDGS